MCFLVGTGLLLSTWWGLVVGVQGFRSWLTSLPIESLFQESYTWNRDLNQLLQPTWREWLLEQSLLLAWLVVGLERSWHVIRSSESEIVRRRYQLLLFWWIVAFIGRNLADILSRTMIVNTAIWNLALLGPTVLLASLGIGTLIERKVSRRGEFFLVILIVCLTIARITMSWLMGLIGGAIAVLFLISGPLFIHSAGRTERSWSQEGWRQLLQITVYGSLLASLFLGLGFRSTNMKAMNDAVHLASLRERLKSFPEVQRISLITAQAPIPMTLNYLLRSRWPTTEIAIREGWDTGLTDAMANESTSPHSRFLILEWTFHDTRFSANTGLAWRIKSIGDPVRFHDRRLSMSLIEPQQ